MFADLKTQFPSTVDWEYKETLSDYAERLSDLDDRLKSNPINLWTSYDEFEVIGRSIGVPIWWISNRNETELYWAIDRSWPSSWYRVDNRETIDDRYSELVKVYSGQSSRTERFRGWLGPIAHRILADRWSGSPMVERIWSGRWPEYPFTRPIESPVSNDRPISVSTKWSNSRVCYYRGILEIEYPSINTPQHRIFIDSLGSDHPSDLPIDVAYLFGEQPMIHQDSILGRHLPLETALVAGWKMVSTETDRRQFLEQLEDLREKCPTGSPRLQRLIDTVSSLLIDLPNLKSDLPKLDSRERIKRWLEKRTELEFERFTKS